MKREEYDKMYRVEERHWWYVSLHELIVRYIAAEYRRKGPLAMLDAGCGTGRLCQLLSPYGSATGRDRSSTAVFYCRERGLIDVAQEDLETADFGNARYDVVTCIDVLYHQAISNEGTVLRKLCAALRPGGMLILQLPAYEFLRSRHDLAVHTRQRYIRHDVDRLLRAAGFSTEKIGYRVSLLFPLIAAYRLLQRMPGGKPSGSSDVWLPPAWVNALLRSGMRFENRIFERFPLPFGTSVFAVARRPAGTERQS